MTNRKILNTTKHRSREIPTESWKFYQDWNNVTFLPSQVELSEFEIHHPEWPINKIEMQNLFFAYPYNKLVNKLS
jgi:hypothetical protein